MADRKFLAGELKHGLETAKRWIDDYTYNRDHYASEAKEEWSSEQCFMCQYYVKLQGVLSDSWGVCSNGISPFDRRVMYEHDGCDFFSPASDEQEFQTQ